MFAFFRQFGHPHSRPIPANLSYPALLLAFWAFAAVPTAVQAFETPAAKTAQMRLVAAEGMQNGVYHAAAEIELSPAAVTYWRQPGEAGVPPKFSFDGSENVAATEVLYPAPSRLDEDGIVAFGYRGGVTFPIRVTPKDRDKPAILKLTLDYAVCETICIPARSSAEIALPQQKAEAADDIVKGAEARVPLLLTSQEMASKATIAPKQGGAKPSWTLDWKGGDDIENLFAEAPDGWYFEISKTNPHMFLLNAVEAPAEKATQPVAIRLTAVGPRAAYEAQLTLDPAAAPLR